MKIQSCSQAKRDNDKSFRFIEGGVIMKYYDTIILGGGPAGLAAAISAAKAKASVLIIERESVLGGILKQCIHDGFGLLRFGERLTGPEYVERYINEMFENKIDYMTLAFVVDAKKVDEDFILTVQSESGIEDYSCKALVIACGCRERTSRQVRIHGERPAGIYSAGTAQYFVNILGLMPTKKCVILGSGDIGLIMARRLTLEGAEVEGVYEIKDTPSGLQRNISQCLNDYNIPLHLSTTVTRVFGEKRVNAVEICPVDEKMNPIKGKERIVECDALILSVGLIPENEIAEKLGVSIDPHTKGAYVDQQLMTSVEGLFSCGNALHVNDLVDYVSESGDLAGKSAAEYVKGTKKEIIQIQYDDNDFSYIVPQYYDIKKGGEIRLYFRSKADCKNKTISVTDGNEELKKKNYIRMLVSEMEAITVNPNEKTTLLKVEMRDRK